MARERARALLRPAALLALGLVIGIAAGAWWRAPVPAAGPVLSAVDIGFAQDMAVHHEQAVLLARTLPADAAPPVRVIAERIVLAQTAEIAQLRAWLQLYDLPLTAPEPMAWMGHGGHRDGHTPPMPGTASTAEIARLAALRGRDAEILFLQLMIRHHRGGLDMAEAGFDTGSAAALTRAALDMVDEQGSEIGQMTALLAARDATPLPFP